MFWDANNEDLDLKDLDFERNKPENQDIIKVAEFDLKKLGKDIV